MLEWQNYATNIAIRNAEQYHNQPGVVVLANNILIHGIEKKTDPTVFSWDVISHPGTNSNTDLVKSPMNGCAKFYTYISHDDVIKWKYFPPNWPFVRGIPRSPVNSPHKGQWRGALMISLICVWINGWVYDREAGDLRRYRTRYDVIVMVWMWLRILDQTSLLL